MSAVGIPGGISGPRGRIIDVHRTMMDIARELPAPQGAAIERIGDDLIGLLLTPKREMAPMGTPTLRLVR